MKNLKIFYKLFISHTAIGLFSVIVLSFIFYAILKNALIQRTIDQLSSINILKKNHVENYFLKTRENILFLMKDSLSKEQLPEFQKLYEFDNIVLLNNQLKPVYSSSSDTFFLSVLNEAYFLNDFQKNTSSFRVIDASRFNPSDSTLLLYALPLMGQSENKYGYILIKEDFQKVQEILYERTGMGSSGESYFVASDSVMRSASRFFPNKPPLQIEVKTDALPNALQEVTDENLIKDYRGVEVLSVHRLLDYPGLPWVLVTEIDYSEAVRPINQLKTSFVFITLLIVFFILLVTFFVSNAISRPILYLKDRIVSLSKGVIPESYPNSKSQDEIGEIGNATNQLIEGLKRTAVFANEIGQGNFKASFTTLSDNDSLGQSLLTMRERLISLNERAVKLVREKGAALMEGQENERKRIIRELHDGIGQLLTVVKLRLEAVEGQDELKDEIRQLVNETIAEVRRISYNVMPNALVDFGLEPALKGLCENIKKYSGLSIDFTYVKDFEKRLNFEISIAIFRIVQEGLNNIIKHANATQAKLEVVKHADRIYVMLKDNGIGFSKEKVLQKRGFGLTSMKERAKLLDGEVEIQSVPGEGTIIEVHIPIAENKNE